MDNDYEFYESSNNKLDLFMQKEASQDFNMFFDNRYQVDYDLDIDEFRQESISSQNEIRTTSSFPNANMTTGSETSSSKIFTVKKDRTKDLKESTQSVTSNYNNTAMSFSEKMRQKKEKAKILLEKKTNRQENLFNENSNQKENNFKYTNPLPNQETEINNISSSKDKEYFITCDDKVIPLTMYPSKLSAKEMRILRNRISAQKSRDRKKFEFEQLKEFSDNLIAENQRLNQVIINKDTEIYDLKRKIDEYINSTKIPIISEFSTNTNNSDYLINSPIIQTRSTISDLSPSNRSIISSGSNFKLGIFSGIMLIVFVLGCFILGNNNNYEERSQFHRLLSTFTNATINNSNATPSVDREKLNNEIKAIDQVNSKQEPRVESESEQSKEIAVISRSITEPINSTPVKEDKLFKGISIKKTESDRYSISFPTNPLDENVDMDTSSNEKAYLKYIIIF